MSRYLVWRLARIVALAFVLVSILFVIFRLVPGNPALLYGGIDVTPAGLKAIAHELGLDQPVWVQFTTYWAHLLHGSGGFSTTYSQDALQVVGAHVGPTLELLGASIALALAVGLPAGLVSGLRPGSVYDVGASGATVVLLSIPNFWLGLLLVGLLSVQWHLLPVTGDTGPTAVILPAAALAARIAAVFARMTRAAVLDVTHEHYVRTARAKGLASMRVMRRHILPNALLTVLTVVGMEVGYLLGGSIVVEVLFAWPGLGLTLINAIDMRDYSLVQTITVFYVLGFLVVNLITDILYTVIDPRIRLHGQALI
jgi:ABC-type dipeptide/oligopeptide/nickel transport system permease component